MEDIRRETGDVETGTPIERDLGHLEIMISGEVWYTAGQLARMTGKTEDCIRNWCRDGQEKAKAERRRVDGHSYYRLTKGTVIIKG